MSKRFFLILPKIKSILFPRLTPINRNTTTKMSKQYTDNTAEHPAKVRSRIKIYQEMKKNFEPTGSKVIHHLGGIPPRTPFECLFLTDRVAGEIPNEVKFVRYEKLPCSIPFGYKKLAFDYEGTPNFKKFDGSSVGFFCGKNFFEYYFEIESHITKRYENHFWLDFCGMPKHSDMECLYWTFLDRCDNFRSLFVTFYVNPRSCAEAKEIFRNCGKSMLDKGNALCNYLKTKFPYKGNFECEVFDTYINDISPMVVIKITPKTKQQPTTTEEEINDMAKTASMENYVKLSTRFTNKQIAVFWKTGIMQVAGYAAAAKRKGML
jgi:hypothetical protein